MDKNTYIVFLIIVLGLLGAGILGLLNMSGGFITTNRPVMLGGDSDVHGCRGSAGYSWCEPKNKCLRIWEEQCYAGVEKEIENLLAQKYNKPTSEVKVTIAKQNDNYLAGSVLFGKGGPGEGGLVLATRIDNVWTIVYDGNGSINCKTLKEEYGFPGEILAGLCD